MFKFKPGEQKFNLLEEYYYDRYAEDLVSNLQIVRQEIDTPEMQDKINNFADKYNFTYDVVRAHILADDMFAATFAKDPSRQSCYQHYAVDWINKNCKNILSCQQLPAGMSNAKYIIKNGALVIGQDNLPSKHSGDTKSIDFEIDAITGSGRKIKIYASHKHTSKCGGTQDNQWKDLQDFMSAAQVNTDNDVYFIALADGDYYNRNMPKEKCTRMEYLNARFSKANKVQALHTFKLNDFIASLN